MRLLAITVWLGFALLGVASVAGAVEVTPLTPAERWGLTEWRVTGVPATANPFDPDLVSVEARFTAPSGRQWAIPAFWHQRYARSLANGSEALQKSGAAEWRLRFTPAEIGRHLVVVTVQTNGQASGTGLTNEFTVAAPSVPPVRPGFIEVAPAGRYFQTDQGAPLPLVGHCVCWHGRRGTYDYDEWFRGMRAAGENWTRLWMAPWAFGIEAEPGALTNYRLDRAWQLDYVLQLAAQNGIAVMLCLDYHGMFEVEPDYWGGNNYWPNNPYNAARGGPCANQDAFFTDPAAKAAYRKRLRYLVARYGAYQNLLAWQFFNEIDNVYRYFDPAHVAAWHAEMGGWLKANDPSRHLVTTSLSGADRSELWGLSQMDFVVHHSYGAPQPAVTLPATVQTLRNRYRKPVMIGEFGTDWRGWKREADPYLRGWRQGLWAGALGGSVGTAMSWWWENIQSENLYPYYAALGTILGRTAWGDGDWSPVTFETSGEPPVTVGEAVGGALPFTAQLPLNAQWGSKPKGQLALATPLSATLASTYLNSFVHGTGHPELRIPLRVDGWFGAGARLTLHVNSVSDGARLAVYRDAAKIFEKSLPNLDGGYAVNNEYNTNFTVDLPAGHHLIEVRNTGGDWFYLDWLKFENVLPSQYSGGWQPSPIATGLRGEAETLVYVVSPQVSFPANATQATVEATRGATLIMTNLPAGRYQAAWYDPATGRYLGETVALGGMNRLELPLPEFREDLAGRLRSAGVVAMGSPTWRVEGQFAAIVSGPAEREYRLEFSEALNLWNPLGVVTNTTGVVEWVDAGSATAPVRFYRARLLP